VGNVTLINDDDQTITKLRVFINGKNKRDLNGMKAIVLETLKYKTPKRKIKKRGQLFY